jgi:hypothetical protein
VLSITVKEAKDLRDRHSVTGTNDLRVVPEQHALPYGKKDTGSKGQDVCNRGTGVMGSIGTTCCALMYKKQII